MTPFRTLEQVSSAARRHHLDPAPGSPGVIYFACPICLPLDGAELQNGAEPQKASVELTDVGLVAHCNRCSGRDVLPELAGPVTTGAWPALAPLDATPNLPAFPVDALPGWLRRFVEEEADFTQTPVELAALLALAAVSGALSGRVIVSPRPGYYEPSQLYVLVSAGSGERKTPVLRDVFRPVVDREIAISESADSEIRDAQVRRRIAEKKANQAELDATRRASKDDAYGNESDALKAWQEADAIVIPPRPRLLADDTTPEAFVGLLADHGRICIASAEAGLLGNFGGRYSSGESNLDAILKAHSGESIRIDRKGSPTVYVPDACAVIALAVQPSVIAGLASKPEFRGRGLLARFLYGMPASRVGYRKSRTHPVAPAVIEEYARRLGELWAMDVDEQDGPRGRRLLLDDQARAAFEEFEERHEPRLRPGADLAGIREWAAKYPGTILRLAATLHAADVGPAYRDIPIALSSINGALAIGEVLTRHAIAAHDLLGQDQQRDDARFLAKWIADGRAGSRFTEREAFNANRGRFSAMPRLRPALTILDDHGYIRREEPPERDAKRGRPRSPAWEVNPSLLSAEIAEIAESPEASSHAVSERRTISDAEIAKNAEPISAISAISAEENAAPSNPAQGAENGISASSAHSALTGDGNRGMAPVASEARSGDAV